MYSVGFLLSISITQIEVSVGVFQRYAELSQCFRYNGNEVEKRKVNDNGKITF